MYSPRTAVADRKSFTWISGSCFPQAARTARIISRNRASLPARALWWTTRVTRKSLVAISAPVAPSRNDRGGEAEAPHGGDVVAHPRFQVEAGREAQLLACPADVVDGVVRDAAAVVVESRADLERRARDHPPHGVGEVAHRGGLAPPDVEDP